MLFYLKSHTCEFIAIQLVIQIQHLTHIFTIYCRRQCYFAIPLLFISYIYMQMTAKQAKETQQVAAFFITHTLLDYQDRIT